MTPEFTNIVSTTLRDVSFWTGFLTIFLFASGRFNEKQQDDLEFDPPFPNRCFTTQFRYMSTALIYALFHVAVYGGLVLAGSIPNFQGVLKELFGEVGKVATNETIGTPAWAAMVVMVVAPTISWVKRVDARLRKWLLGFANIPVKARRIGDEIIVAIRPPVAGVPFVNLSKRPIDELISLFDDLGNLRTWLSDSNGTPTRVGEFLAGQTSIVKALDVQFENVRESYEAFSAKIAGQPSPQVESFRRQFSSLVRRHARLIACSVLYTKSDEFSARELLRMGGCTNIDSSSFRFGKSQAILGGLLVFLVCATVGPLASFLTSYFGTNSMTLSQFLVSAKLWAVWGVVAALAFLAALMLAVAVQLWLIDEDQNVQRYDWTAKIMIMVSTLFGCFAVAAVPMFFGSVISGLLQAKPYNPLQTAYALTPAVIGILFIYLSRRRADQSMMHNAVVDFCLFGGAGAAASYFVGGIDAAVELARNPANGWAEFHPVLLKNLLPVAAVSFVVCGAFGALQCSASRRYIGGVKKHREELAALTRLAAA